MLYTFNRKLLCFALASRQRWCFETLPFVKMSCSVIWESILILTVYNFVHQICRQKEKKSEKRQRSSELCPPADWVKRTDTLPVGRFGGGLFCTPWPTPSHNPLLCFDLRKGKSPGRAVSNDDLTSAFFPRISLFLFLVSGRKWASCAFLTRRTWIMVPFWRPVRWQRWDRVGCWSDRTERDFCVASRSPTSLSRWSSACSHLLLMRNTHVHLASVDLIYVPSVSYAFVF